MRVSSKHTAMHASNTPHTHTRMQRFHTLAVSGVPVITADNRPAGHRLVTLIDVMYENRYATVQASCLRACFGQCMRTRRVAVVAQQAA